MFGRRADGRKVKGLDIMEKSGPYFMPQRIDAVNYFSQAINCENIDKFVKEERKRSGLHFSYTEILMTAIIRMLYQRPKINRFVNNCIIYQRNKITISMAIKKKLTDDGEEVTIKMPFTGRENLADVKRIFEEEIAKNVKPNEEHETTKTAGFLCRLPNLLYKFAITCIKLMDRYDMLPRKLVDVSPFHTSVFMTDLRSIKLDKIYHHLYNFGNTSIFISLGKVVYRPVSNKAGEIKTEKQLQLGFSLDDRICDGLYYANTLSLLREFMTNPEKLMERLPEPELSEKEKKKKQKLEEKKRKKVEKKSKKDNKEGS